MGTGILINMLRRIVDKHDEVKGLKVRQTFECTALQTRNTNRREAFRIDMENVQCPVFNDNRCCGSCDLTPTCDYATNCNCYGYTKGALGGTDEGYYMRENDNDKYGRMKEDKTFDWEYYKKNKYKEE